MHEEMLIAGQGGQGVLFMGRLLAESAILEDREVVWLPSYGGEKRGGAVHCTVIISEQRIGTLFVNRPTAAIAMNEDSFARLEPKVKSSGLFVVNRSRVSTKTDRRDIRVSFVPANDLAAAAGDPSVANLVALGVYLAEHPIVTESSIATVLDRILGASRKHLYTNKKGLAEGHSWARANPAEGGILSSVGG